jgi:aminomethyltransferase
MTLKRTPLYECHVAAGAKMVDFGGFDMPLKYTSETEEHMAVRQGVGLFDVSHMGEVFVEGADALLAITKLVTNDPHKIVDGQCMYAGLLHPGGGFIDDVIVNRFSAERFLICVNASNQDKDFNHIRGVCAGAGFEVEVRNEGPAWSQIAVQGPKAVDLVAQLAGDAIRAVKGYHVVEGSIDIGAPHGAVPAIIARTGYTGEDGFELYVHNIHAPALWNALVARGGQPCGLACRDTLRLEAGMCLYGNDIDEHTTPLEANLGWIVKLEDRERFIGHAALDAQKREGVTKLLRGIVMIDRGIARHGYEVKDVDGHTVGLVTSGTQSPFVNKAIAMAYIDKVHAALGNEVFVDVRGKLLRAKVEKLPFYKRAQ